MHKGQNSPEINLPIYGNVIFNKCKGVQWGEEMELGKLYIHMQANEIGTLILYIKID